MRTHNRVLLQGVNPLRVCQEVVARGLHPEDVDVDTGNAVLPLVLDDRHHLLVWLRLYSRCLAARNLLLAGAVARCRWEIGAALVAAADTPCFLDEVYLTELRDLLRSAERAVAAGETTIEAKYAPTPCSRSESGSDLTDWAPPSENGVSSRLTESA